MRFRLAPISVTLNGRNAPVAEINKNFGAHRKNFNEDSLLAGASNESGVVRDGNFWRFEWLLRKLQR